MNKLPARVRARRGFDYGCPRYDGDVWKYVEPSTERAKEFEPVWSQLDQEMAELEVHYFDEWVDKRGRR